MGYWDADGRFGKRALNYATGIDLNNSATSFSEQLLAYRPGGQEALYPSLGGFADQGYNNLVLGLFTPQPSPGSPADYRAFGANGPDVAYYNGLGQAAHQNFGSPLAQAGLYDASSPDAQRGQGLSDAALLLLMLEGGRSQMRTVTAAKTGIPRNAAVFEIETQGGMLTRDGRILQSGAVKSRTDFLNQTPVRRVDFDHAHGNLGAPHVNDLHVNPNNPLQINSGRPRLPEPGEYLSPVLSDPRIQGGVFRP